MTERVRSQVQESKIGFLRGIEDLTKRVKLWDSKFSKHRARTSRNRKISAHLLGYVSETSQERLPKQALLAEAKYEKTSWTTYN